MGNDRRLMAVAISFELLVDMVRSDYKVLDGVECIEGVPPDAKLVDSYTDPAVELFSFVAPNVGYLVFEHESFELVLDGKPIPAIAVKHRRIFRE